MLYVFRGFSGVANGGVASLSAMVVSDIVTLEDRGKWQGIIGAFVGIGNMVGPFIAAAFVQNSTWRGFFWTVSPFTVVCGFLCLWLLPESKNRLEMNLKQEMKKVDFGGLFFASGALIMILIPVAGGGDYFEWDSPMVIGMLTAGGICMLAFIYIERSVALLPMMPRTYIPHARTHTQTNQKTNSITFQKHPCSSNAHPKLSLRNRRLQPDLLPPPLLPERATPLTHPGSLSHASLVRLPGNCLRSFGPVHFAAKTLRGGHLAWVLPLDSGRRINLHVRR